MILVRPISLPLWKDPALWFVLALGFAFGSVYNVLPVTFPAFRGDFHVGVQQLAFTQTVFFCSALAVSVLAGFLTDQLGLRGVAVFALASVVVGLLVMGNSVRFDSVVAGAFVFGLGVTTLNVVCNALISDKFTEKRQSILFIWGIIDAVGAIATPALLGLWLGRSGGGSTKWRSAYFVIAAIMALIALWGMVLDSSAFSSSSAADVKQTSRSSFGSVARNPAIYAVGLGVCLHGVSQVGMISWIGHLYQSRHAIGPAEAAYFISANSAGFFVGRSLLTWMTARWKIPELLVLGCCATGGGLAFVTTVLAPTYWSGLALFTIAGAFVSGNAPSLYSYAGLRFAGSTATAFGILTGIGNVGSAGGMYLIGLIGSSLGMETGIWLMPLFSVALGVLGLVWYVRTKRQEAVMNEVMGVRGNLL
jgi:DHA1 family bicyclomycin/chloramphenicol resistance-like MFS transporter